MMLVLGILIGASMAVMMIAFLCIGIERRQHPKSRKRKIRKLCPTCRTGMEMIQLDCYGECPYLRCYMNNKCAYYEPISKEGQTLIKPMETM